MPSILKRVLVRRLPHYHHEGSLGRGGSDVKYVTGLEHLRQRKPLFLREAEARQGTQAQAGDCQIKPCLVAMAGGKCVCRR